MVTIIHNMRIYINFNLGERPINIMEKKWCKKTSYFFIPFSLRPSLLLLNYLILIQAV